MGARDKEPLHVLFTMDCLPPKGSPVVAGPPSWDDAIGAVVSFGQTLAEEGLAGTFFVAPEGLQRFRGAMDDLASAGMELGVLCHPQLSGYQSFLGSYGYDRQREIIGLARTLWEREMGGAPASFRAGFFSCNDYTFQILCLEQFRQGSCSLPGRVDPDQCSLWRGAYPFAHHTDPLDRKAEGTMEFFEVPVTSDFAARDRVSAETFTPPHLRIEDPGINDYLQQTLDRYLDSMAAGEIPLKSIVFVTQNSTGWGKADDPHVERLHNVASLLRQVADSRGMSLSAATTEMLHTLADRQWRQEREPG